MIKSFTDLEAWREAHRLTLSIYKSSKKFPKDELFGLVSQIRRAVISIESNIAEGFSRYHFKDRLNFYYQARGSIAEVQSQSITAKDLGYIDEIDLTGILDTSQKTQIILSGLIKSTEELSRTRKIT